MTCDTNNTISADTIANTSDNFALIKTVVESALATTLTPDSVTINTLRGQLALLGFQAPELYAGSIVFGVNDATKTIDRNGIVYAPLATALDPSGFTTTGTWVADDEDKFFPIQISDSSNLTYDPGGAGAIQTTMEDRLRHAVIASDYSTLQEAADAAEGIALIFDLPSFALTTELTIKNSYIVFYDSVISGSGSIRGVITNDEIPWAGIMVAANIELAKNRGDTVAAADFYIDSCLGDDTDNGTSSTTPIATMAQLKVLINAEIALAGDNPIVCVMRGGRYELSAQIDLDTSQATASITIKNNPSEKPVITGPLKWFFRDGETAANDGTQIYNLYAADLENKEIPISTTSAY
ncbi:unnamed protein product, partial [marine sediment metagenome]